MRIYGVRRPGALLRVLTKQQEQNILHNLSELQSSLGIQELI